MADNMRKQANAAENVQGQITVASRAPVSSDKGVLWVYYTATSAVLYCRNPNTGSWYAQA